MLANLFALLPWTIVALYLLLCELMDTKARLSQLEEDWPSAAKLVNNRAMRLVLLIVCLGFLGKNVGNSLAISPPPSVTIKAPPAPIITSIAPTPRQEVPDAVLRFVNIPKLIVADSTGKFFLPEFQVKNFGGKSVPTQLSARLYLSVRPTVVAGEWEPLNSSDDPQMPVELWSGGFAEISPGEIWHSPALTAQIQGGLKEKIQGKLRIFYGAEKPADLEFTIDVPPTN
jgi:hypothetical protein